MATSTTRSQRAAAELAAHAHVFRPEDVVDRLQAGLTLLRDELAGRLHIDVEREFGVDSMVAPLSLSHEFSQLRLAGEATDAYASVVAADEILARGYVDAAEGWLVDWLVELRFGDRAPTARQEHAEPYRALADKARRLRFVALVHKAVPESMRTPPVLFLLFPLGVRIVAAMAFGDEARAQQLRAEQVSLLSAIPECHECRGRVLANDERCRCCGNPVWTFAFLRAT